MKKSQQADRNTVIEKFRYLHHLLACMKCGVWGAENFVSGNCDHFQCGQCLSHLGAQHKVKCGIRYPYESSNECSKFFGYGKLKPETFINEKYFEAKALMHRYDVHLEEILSPPSSPNISSSLQQSEENKISTEEYEAQRNGSTEEGEDEFLTNISKQKIFEVSSQEPDIFDESENGGVVDSEKEKSMSIYEINDSFSAPPENSRANTRTNKSTNRSAVETRNSVSLTGFDFFNNSKTKQGAKTRCSKDRKQIQKQRKRTSTDDQTSGTEIEKGKENDIVLKALRTSATSANSKRALFDLSTASNQSTERIDASLTSLEIQQELDENVIRKLCKRNHNGETELHQESKRGNLDRVLQLLELGADPNAKDNANLRPLHEHKALQNHEVCRTLLEFGADPRVHGGDSDVTPLHVAVQNGFTDVISLLIQCGADIYATAETADGKKFTPLSVAKLYGNLEVIELLESAHAKYHCNENCSEDNCLKDYVSTPLRKSKFNISETARLNKTLTPVAKQPKDGSITQFSHTGLCSKSKPQCQVFSKQFKIKINLDFDESCNVLVLAKKAHTNEYSRTVKSATAILRGCLLIDMKWVEESLQKGQLLSYQEYLIDSFSQNTESVKRAREAHLLSKKLFSGLEVFVKATNDVEIALGCQQLRELLSLGGAKLLPREPKPSSLVDNKDFMTSTKSRPEFLPEDSGITDMRVVVVVGGSLDGVSTASMKQVIPGLYNVTSHWVLECICSFSIISCD